MPWIKKNPHLVTLLVIALLLVAGAVFIVLGTKSFPEKFAGAQEKVTPQEKIEPLDVAQLDATQKELEAPAQWGANGGLPLPFVPVRFKISKENTLEKMEAGSTYQHPITKDFIPDKWFLDHRLPLTDRTVVGQDPDGDGFTNADEWLGKNDPLVATDHPAYHTKLYLKQYIRVPFLLTFNAYDGDPKKPEELTFQINSRSVRIPSQFLKIGDKVVNDRFTIKKFEYKVAQNDKIGGDEEVSELTLENNETKALVVLIFRKEIDSPDSYALFHYVWPNPPVDFKVPKLGKFVLLPNKEQFYQVLDITENSASIKLPSGETVSVGPPPPGVP